MSATLDPDDATAARERRRAAEMPLGEIPDVTYGKWDDRAPEHVEIDVAEAWHDAEPVHFPSAANGTVVRWHPPSDMLLFVRMGAIVSTYPLTHRSENEQRYVREQVTE